MLPRRSRRSARSTRRCSRRRTRPSLRVRRASTPLRIHTSSCAQNLSKRAVGDLLGGELVALARLVRREVAGVGAQHAAVQLHDARGDAIEKGAVVGDDDAGRQLRQQFLEALDAVDVEMIGRLIEQQELGLQREGEGERRTLALAAGTVVGRRARRRDRSGAGIHPGGIAFASARVRPRGSGWRAGFHAAWPRAASCGSCSTKETRRPSRRCSSPSSSAAQPGDHFQAARICRCRCGRSARCVRPLGP